MTVMLRSTRRACQIQPVVHTTHCGRLGAVCAASLATSAPTLFAKPNLAREGAVRKLASDLSVVRSLV